MLCNLHEYERNSSLCSCLFFQMMLYHMCNLDSLLYLFPVVFLQKQLNNLRDMLKKCLDKRNRLSRSGAAARELPKCQYLEQMAFLCETSANKATESNLRSTIDPLGSPFSEDFVITPPNPGSICEVVTETPSRLSPNQIGKVSRIRRLQY